MHSDKYSHIMGGYKALYTASYKVTTDYGLDIT
jgi:hypothetical protein